MPKSRKDAKNGILNLFRLSHSSYPLANIRKLALRITTGYLILGSVWILTSDTLLKAMFQNLEFYAFLQTAKGWLYIILTACLLYWIVYSSLQKIQDTTKELSKSYQSLSETYHELLNAQEELKEKYNEVKRMEKQVNRIAYFDELTKLPNKNFLKNDISGRIAKSGQTGERFAILYIGLDHFKKINNTLGYEYGDEVLLYIAKKLLRLQRENDIVCRYGGDEFIFVLSGNLGENELNYTAQAIIEAIEKPEQRETVQNFVTVSIGIAAFPQHGQDFDALMTSADTAMQCVKENGGGQSMLCSAEMHARRLEVITLENDLRRAITNGEFELYFQPLIHAQSGAVSGTEALIRWNHPLKGKMLPGSFIPVAEKSGLIKLIGAKTIFQVFRQSREWAEKGLLPISISVNLSPVEFNQVNFVDKLLAAAVESGVDLSRIALELTESTILDNIGKNIEMLHTLREHKVKIWLDDFGTGYSSLSYLRELPIDGVKIDKSFIRDIYNAKDREITAAMIELCHNLGLEVIAEGVEQREEYELLTAMGCDKIQGYFFYRPMPGCQLENLLNQIKSGNVSAFA